METAKIIAGNLKAAMEAKGINAQELSMESRVPGSIISRLLNAKTASPGVEILKKLADQLDVTVNDLIEEKKQIA